MPNHDADEWLRIVIEKQEDSNGEVSWETLIGVLGSFGNLVYLLHGAMVLESKDPLPRIARLRKEFFRSFSMSSKPPKLGSFELSVRLGVNEEPSRLADSLKIDRPSPTEFVSYLGDSVDVVSNDQQIVFDSMFPEESNKKRVIQSMKNLRTDSSYDWRLESIGRRTRRIFHSEKDLHYIRLFENSVIGSTRPQLHVEELTLVAPIEQLNLKDETFTAVHQDGVVFDGLLSEVFHEEEKIFDKYMIEVDGEFKIDEESKVHSVQSESGRRLVNTDPITLTELVVDNEHLVIEPPLRCEVEFDRESLCYGLRGDLELILYAYSRQELVEVLEETLQDWWLVYVVSDEDELSESGKVKRREIAARIKLETKGNNAAD